MGEEKMKICELCSAKARMYCESDQASLCWDCDTKVHSANFLVARHSRSLLCHVCQSPTAWTATGAKLGTTVSVCERCVNGCERGGAQNENRGAGNEEESDTEDENEDGDEDDATDDEEAEEIDAEDIQVVPWSSTSTPPPASSSSSEESSNGEREGSLKRTRDTISDRRFDENPGSSLPLRYFHSKPPTTAARGGDGVSDDEEAASVDSLPTTSMRRPFETRRRGSFSRVRTGGSAIVDSVRRFHDQEISSSAAIDEFCKLSGESVAVDLDFSESS